MLRRTSVDLRLLAGHGPTFATFANVAAPTQNFFSREIYAEIISPFTMSIPRDCSRFWYVGPLARRILQELQTQIVQVDVLFGREGYDQYENSRALYSTQMSMLRLRLRGSSVQPKLTCLNAQSPCELSDLRSYCRPGKTNCPRPCATAQFCYSVHVMPRLLVQQSRDVIH